MLVKGTEFQMDRRNHFGNMLHSTVTIVKNNDLYF